MSALNQEKQNAIEAVARKFSATWEKSSGPPDAYIKADGKQVAVDVAILKGKASERGNDANPRLRFDKVVTRLMERLQASLGEVVPDSTTVILTVTAPIRLPGKTATALEDKVQALLVPGPPGQDVQETICGNRITIRIVKNEYTRTPKLIGFVHNPDSDPLRLVDMTQKFLELVGARTLHLAPRVSGARWLVVTGAGATSSLEVYRSIHSQLRLATDFEKTLVVFEDGQVEVLTE